MNDTLPTPATMTRRRFLAAASAVAATGLAGCASVPPGPAPVALRPEPVPSPAEPRVLYAAAYDGGFEIPAVPIEQIDPIYYRQVVADPTGEQPGTVVVDTGNHFLYLVQENGQAMRYGVGLGREGFEWSGRGVIEWKQPWPRWFPPEEMIARQPELEKYRARQIAGTNDWEGGMPAGIDNPLGARALYIFQDGKDTLYRLHGSPEWWSIGKSVSSGCVRLMNQDIIHLYDQVPEGAAIVVTSLPPPFA